MNQTTDDVQAESVGPMGVVTFSEKRGRFEIFARAESVGDDVLVVIWGGIAHIGAIGIAQPRPSLRDSSVMSATSSVFTFLGHKEDVPAKAMSEALAARLNKKVVVVAGIHWDNALPEEIGMISEACEALVERIASKLSR
jgi:hypothetical protein